MKLSLLITRGSNQGREVPIARTPFLIGRDPECQLRPHSPTISRRHCAFLIDDGRVFVRDFGSTNGTIVNGVRVTDIVELHNADQLQVDKMHFEVRLTMPARAPVAPPLTSNADDDSVAALLLELQDGEVGQAAIGAEPGSPEDSTVQNIPALDAAPASSAGKKDKPPAGKDSATMTAAMAILSKYKKMRKQSS